MPGKLFPRHETYTGFPISLHIECAPHGVCAEDDGEPTVKTPPKVNISQKARFLALVGLLTLATQVDAQRHPESQGPLPYYRDEPGVLPEPEWLHRPEFIRGPRDRYERGANRLFLATGDDIPYLNYAEERFILSQRELIPWFQPKGRPWKFRNTRWDRMGNYMGSPSSTSSPASGYLRLFSWEETRSDDNGLGRSFIDHRSPSPWGPPAGYNDATLRIGHYNYKDLHWTATVGQSVRSYFTPLTLAQSHLSVARLDFDNKFGKDRATILLNRGRTRPGGLFSEWASVGGETEDANPVLMYGLHYKHRFGRYAQFGTTVLNQILNQPGSGSSSPLKGDLPYDMLGPRVIRVFIGDDSPKETLHNAKVYGVDIVVRGTREDQPVTLSNRQGEFYDPSLEPVIVGGRLLSGEGREAVGRETVIYEFTIPSDITATSARFFADVSDDYRIGVRQIYDFPGINRSGELDLEERVWPDDFVVTEAVTRRPFKWDIGEGEEPYYTVARSDGIGKNGSNRRVVQFDHGMPTGQNLFSFDAQANLVGLKFSGEIVRNNQNFIYPVGSNDGRRTTHKALAYWLNVKKDIGIAKRLGAQLGAEVFRLDPNYSGGYDSQRGGMAFHLDSQDKPGARVKSDTQEYGLVEDNDDDDQWPDDFVEDTASPGRLSYPGWPNASVYPGLDENLDNIPDVDRNENFVPDWDEAFLTYDVDPPEFVYGIDFNNNGMPDFRENDDLPDYPYRRDQKGQHFFLLLDRLGGWGNSISAGYYKSNEIAGGTESKSMYLRYALEKERDGVGSLQINFDTKIVEDNIQDDSYVYIVPPNDDDVIPWLNKPDHHPDVAGRYRPATPDPLLMRDSWVNTAYIDVDYLKLSNMRIHNALLWTRNSMAEIPLEGGAEGELLQAEDVRSRLILINKVDRTWLLKSIALSTKFKHRLIYENIDSEENPRTSASDFIPIVMGEYALTPKTRLVLGAQGMPFLPMKHWDRANKDGTYSQTDYAFMYKMRSEYFGFENDFFFGYLLTDREYTRLRDRDFNRGTFFVEVITPF